MAKQKANIQNVPGTTGDQVPSTKPVDEEIPVPKSTLEKLLARVETLEKDNELLKEVADKDKLNRIALMRAGGKLIKTVRLNTINNKIIIGWAKVKDDVYFDEQGRLHEEQIIMVFYEDGDKTQLDYRAFSRLRATVSGEVIAETKDNDGNTNYKIQLPDGHEINIDVKFVN